MSTTSFKRAFSRAAIAIALVLASLAGCGGGSSTETMSKAQVIKVGNAICRKAEKEKREEFYAYTKDNPTVLKSKNGRKELVEAVGLPPVEEVLEELKGLEPESGGSEYKAIVAALEAGISAVEAEPISVVNDATNPLNKANQLAQDFGFQDCSTFF